MAIGFWEVIYLLLLFFGIIIVSRLVERFRTKRVCPACGWVIRTHTQTCPTCKSTFPTKV